MTKIESLTSSFVPVSSVQYFSASSTGMFLSDSVIFEPAASEPGLSTMFTPFLLGSTSLDFARMKSTASVSVASLKRAEGSTSGTGFVDVLESEMWVSLDVALSTEVMV